MMKTGKKTPLRHHIKPTLDPMRRPKVAPRLCDVYLTLLVAAALLFVTGLGVYVFYHGVAVDINISLHPHLKPTSDAAATDGTFEHVGGGLRAAKNQAPAADARASATAPTPIADLHPHVVDYFNSPENSRGFIHEQCLDYLPQNPSERHIVPPPPGPVILVCCVSTKGVLNIAVHNAWARQGAARFLDMVRSGFFESRVALFRALKGFLVQFGLAGSKEAQQAFDRKGNLRDDPPWLPQGPPGRQINGTKRYQKGYLGYAGAGNNSRGTQLIMAFEDNFFLGGGSPWEVPFGQLVGNDSFKTLSEIYTGYGENVHQSKIRNRGLEYLKEFPLLDYIDKCQIIKRNVPWSYTHVWAPVAASGVKGNE